MKREVWGGLSDDDKKELSNLKVLNEIYNRAASKGFASDVYCYITEVLDSDEFIHLLKELNVRFVKEEEDLILDEDEGDNICGIANYICSEIDKNKSSLSVDVDKIEEMDEEDLKTFLDSLSPSELTDILSEYFTENQNVKKDFVTFCIRKLQEPNNK